jgi:hypothetical protein
MHSPLPKSSVKPSLRTPNALRPKSAAAPDSVSPSKSAAAPKNSPPAANALRPEDRRRSRRRLINRMAKIQFGAGTAPRDCVITDISAGGVRLRVEGFQVPDAFVLYVNADGITRECVYRVVWRLDTEIGAAFVRFVKRSAVTAVR